VTALGVLGYLEKVFGFQLSQIIYIILLATFVTISIGQLGFSLYRERTAKAQISELELRANTIQSIQLHVSIDAMTPSRPIGNKETSVGLMSAVALFSKDKTRYRFVTDYQYSMQQISENVNRLMLVYSPEDPTQLLGKPISYLQNMDAFKCDYSDFFRQAGFDPGSMGNPVSITVFLNGVDVVVLDDRRAAPGVLANGQATMNMSKDFAQVSNLYSSRIRAKMHE